MHGVDRDKLNSRGFTSFYTPLNVNYTDILHSYSGCFDKI